MKPIIMLISIILCAAWIATATQPAASAPIVSAPRATLVPDVEPTPDTRPEPTPDPRDYTAVPAYPAPPSSGYPAPPSAPATKPRPVQEQVGAALDDIWRAVTGQ